VSIVGIIVYNNKGSTNLINHLVKIFVFLWDDSEFIIFFLAITASLCFGYTINDVPEGWASQGGGTTGGIGGEKVTVSNMSELKKEVGSSGEKIILVEPGIYSGSIVINSSNKSILSTAPGVKIKGTMRIGGKNIIIRNDAKGIFEVPRYPSALIIRFNNKSISNIYVPSGF
jgi:pectate lyase